MCVCVSQLVVVKSPRPIKWPLSLFILCDLSNCPHCTCSTWPFYDVVKLNGLASWVAVRQGDFPAAARVGHPNILSGSTWDDDDGYDDEDDDGQLQALIDIGSLFRFLASSVGLSTAFHTCSFTSGPNKTLETLVAHLLN